MVWINIHISKIFYTIKLLYYQKRITSMIKEVVHTSYLELKRDFPLKKNVI